MSFHVSVLELHQFVSRGEGSPEFEAHVSDCSECAARLSAFARRHVPPLARALPDVEEPRRLGAVMMAFAACLMVMVVQSVRIPSVEGPVMPEGVHGISGGDDLRSAETAMWRDRAAGVETRPVDSGVR